MRIREAKSSEDQLLSELARKAKAHWPYSIEQLKAWQSDLTITAQEITSNPTYVAEIETTIIGFYALAPEAGQLMLEHLWVDPQAMGHGVGRALVRHALSKASEIGAMSLLIESDPNAEGFYLALGAQRVGSKPAPIASCPERSLPRLLLSVEQPNPSIERTSQGLRPCAASHVKR